MRMNTTFYSANFIVIFLLFALINAPQKAQSQCDINLNFAIDTSMIDVIPFNEDSCTMFLPYSLSNSGSCDLALFSVDAMISLNTPVLMDNFADTITGINANQIHLDTLMFTSDIFMDDSGNCIDTMDFKWRFELSSETPPIPDVVTIPCPSGDSGSIVVCANDNSIVCGIIGDCSLPIDLISFEAIKQKSEVLLLWKTASEINNEGWSIEHSADGNDFREINFTSGQGNANVVNNYSFLHKNPNNGQNYYRLVQRDFDGRITYSDIVNIQFDIERGKISLYPNPAKDELFVQHNLTQGLIEIFDLQGKIVKQQSFNNELITSINSNELLQGLYHLRVSSGSEITTLKFIKN